MVDHNNLVTTSLHPPGYKQTADPGAVGAGRQWAYDEYGDDNVVLNLRNAGDLGWCPVPRDYCWILTITTTDATITELLMNGAGGDQMVLPDDTTWFFEIHAAARRTDADNESAGYVWRGVIDRNAGVAALVGAVTAVYTNEDTAAWSMTIDADVANDALRVRATGEVGKTISWKAKVWITEVTG